MPVTKSSPPTKRRRGETTVVENPKNTVAQQLINKLRKENTELKARNELLKSMAERFDQYCEDFEEERKPSLFEDAAEIAEYYMASYVIMELSENPEPDVISTVLSRKTRLLLLCRLNATSLAVFRSFCIRDTPDVLIVREDSTVTVDPDYEELLEQLLGAPFSLDLQFRVFFSDPLKFDSFKEKFLAAQDNQYAHCDEQQGVKMYKIGDYDQRRLVFNDKKMCIMLVWVGMPRQN